MQRMSGDGGDADEYDETRETFKAFDKSGNDKITVSDLKSVLENLTVKLTSDELNGIIEELESAGSELGYSGTSIGLLRTHYYFIRFISFLFFFLTHVTYTFACSLLRLAFMIHKCSYNTQACLLMFSFNYQSFFIFQISQKFSCMLKYFKSTFERLGKAELTSHIDNFY